MGESVTVAVDGASLLAGLTTLGTAIGGGVIGAVKMMLNYFTRQETKRDLVVRTLIESTNKNTEALTRLAERIGDCPHRTPRDEMRRELLAEPLVRGIGLSALDLISPLRHFVARRMIWGARAWP